MLFKYLDDHLEIEGEPKNKDDDMAEWLIQKIYWKTSIDKFIKEMRSDKQERKDDDEDKVDIKDFDQKEKLDIAKYYRDLTR